MVHSETLRPFLNTFPSHAFYLYACLSIVRESVPQCQPCSNKLRDSSYIMLQHVAHHRRVAIIY